jgi:hypothetical protein
MDRSWRWSPAKRRFGRMLSSIENEEHRNKIVILLTNLQKCIDKTLELQPEFLMLNDQEYTQLKNLKKRLEDGTFYDIRKLREEAREVSDGNSKA